MARVGHAVPWSVSATVLRPSDGLSAINGARAGVGLGFIASENQRLTRDGVVYRPITAPGPHLDVGVAYHTDGIAPASQAFLDAARRAGRAMR